MTEQTESELVTETILFCRALRDRGLSVTPSEAIDAVRILDLVDFDDRQETFLALRSALTSRIEDFPVFEELFDAFWRKLGRNTQPQKLIERNDLSTAKQRVRLSSQRRNQKGLAFFLENWGKSESEDAKPIKLPGASSNEALSEKDFSLFEADQIEEISRIVRRVIRRLARRPSRRWEPVRRGQRINPRRSLRQSLKTGGELIDLSFKRRKQKKTRLVVICDVSGSMDIYSRLLLQFVYGLQNSFARVETFVFSTSLQRITSHMKNRTYAEALERLSINIRGWSGGTLIGPSIATLNADWPRLVDSRTIVIIMSDGWDTAAPEELDQSLASLKRRAGRLIWLNPLLARKDYEPLTQGMQAALPHIDVFAPLNNLASLRALERHLVL